MARLTNAAVRHQVYLERLKTAEARDFNKIIPILDQQIAAAMAKLGTPVQSLTRAKLNALVRELKKAQDDALAGAQGRLMKRLRTIAAYESDFEARSITAHGPKNLKFKPASSTTAWESAVIAPISATGDLLEPFIKDLTAREVAQLNKVIRRGYSEGWTNDEITRVLRGTKRLNYKDGLLPALGKHNAAIVRTAVQHVSSLAREATWSENRDLVRKYRWVSVLDSRTSSQCRSLDSKVFKIGKGPRPPIHINCRSTTVPIVTGFEDLADALVSDERGKGKGMSYYEWLKTQNKAFQDDVLGPKRAELFRKGGLSAERFAQLQLGASFAPLSLEEMRKLEPRAFSRAGI